MNSNQYDNGLLFFMQTGGTLTPQMIQAAQQLGQLPQLQAGSSMNDISKMHMREQNHYSGGSMGMFRRGGTPTPSGNRNQEIIDQEYMNPDKKYNDRINKLLSKVKQGALQKVQEDMFNVANEYGQEAMQIEDEMMMAQKGAQYSKEGLGAANAWYNKAKQQKDLVKPMINTLNLGSGLEGYFGGVDAFAANPLNQYYIKDIDISDLDKAQDGKAIAGALPQDDPGKIVRNADGSVTVYNLSGDSSTTFPSEESFKTNFKAATSSTSLPSTSVKVESDLTGNKAVARTQAQLEAEIQAAKDAEKKAAETKPGTTTTGASTADDNPEAGITPGMLKGSGDGLDYWRQMSDPNGVAGGFYSKNRKGQNVPLAFYDPNMKLNYATPTYRNNLANVFRKEENKKLGALKSIRYDFTQSAAPQVVEQPSERQIRREDRQINRDDRRQTRADEITQKYQEKIAKLTNANPGVATPWDNQASQSALTPEMIAAMNQDAQRVIPAEGPMSSQERVDNIPNMGYSPLGSVGNANVRQTANYLSSSDRPAELDAYLQSHGYKKGGTIHKFLKKFQDGSENPDDEKRRKDLLKILQYDPDDYTGNPDINSPDQIELQDPVDLQMQQEQTPTKKTRATYDLGKSNPFLAPFALAGLDMFAGAMNNMDAKEAEKKARDMFTADKAITVMPGGLSGAKGDYSINEGYFRAPNMVATQFPGYNNKSKMAKNGGGFKAGQEYYMDDAMIQNILAAGGEIEYLD